jgi:hypothetical protein
MNIEKFTQQLLGSLILLILLGTGKLYAQNIGINTDGSAPDNSSMLDIKSDYAGLLIPRISLSSLTDGTTITSPATSLLIYNTNTGIGLGAGYYYNNGTSGSPAWVPLLNINNAWLTTGNAGTTAGTNFLGTTDAQDFIIKTNNSERLKFDKNGGSSGATMKITSTADTATGLRIVSNSLTKGSGIELISGSTTGGSGTNYDKMLFIKRYGANANSNHKSFGIYSSVLNSGTGSLNCGASFTLKNGYYQYGVSTDITGVNDATTQTLVGFSASLNGNGNSNGTSSSTGLSSHVYNGSSYLYGLDIDVSGATYQNTGIKVQTAISGGAISYGINCGISGDNSAGLYGRDSYAGYFNSNIVSSISNGWSYGIESDAVGITSGYNCAAWLNAVNAPTGQNYALIVPHESALMGWGGWVGIGCLDPQRLMQVDGTMRIGGAHNLGRIEIENTYHKQTTLQAGSNPSSNLKFVLPSNTGSIDDVLKVSSVTADSTILTWASVSSASWSLTGNSGTTPGTNYIGTTDYKDFVLKADNVERIRLVALGSTILKGSNVGIGTNLPQSLLHVAGTEQLGTKDSTDGVLKFFRCTNAYYTALTGSLSATANTTYTLPTADGTSGQLLKTNGSGVMSWSTPVLASSLFSNQGSATTVLHGNASGNPSWAAVDLANDVTGTLPVTKGGTGITSATQGGVIYASSSSALASTAAGTAGQVLTSNGTSAPTWQNPRTTVYLKSDVTDNTGNCTLTDVTGLSFSVAANTTYNFHADIIYTAAATTTGSQWSISGPAIGTGSMSYTSYYQLTGTTSTNNAAMTSYDQPGSCNATSINVAYNHAYIDGTITTGATSGTLIVRMATEVTGSAIVAKAGSYLTYW